MYENAMLFMDAYICLILTLEFWYDWKLNQHVKSLKKRTQKRFEFSQLTEGEMK